MRKVWNLARKVWKLARKVWNLVRKVWNLARNGRICPEKFVRKKISKGEPLEKFVRKKISKGEPLGSKPEPMFTCLLIFFKLQKNL